MLSEIAAPASIVLPGWAQWIVLLASLAVALRTIWVKVVRPISRTLVLVEDVMPTLQEIAHHFKPNGGSSLYDIVSSTRTDLTEVRASVEALKTEQRRLDAQVNPRPGDPVAIDRIDRLRQMVREAVQEALSGESGEDASDASPPPTIAL